MPNSSEKRKKQESENSSSNKSDVSLLSNNILDSSSSSDDDELQPSEVDAVLQSPKPQTSFLGKTWNGFKQLFNYVVPNVMNEENNVENENSMDTGSNEDLTATETTEESEGFQSDPFQQHIEHVLDVQQNADIEESIVNGWNCGEVVDCSKGHPLIMEVAAGIPFESMPDLLRLRIIGTTINYILLEEMKGCGFITQDVINELFKEYTGVALDDACKTINTTFKDFVDAHFSTLFKNCYPHGLARNEVVDKPVNSFGSFGAQAAVSSPPTIKAIEHSSATSSSSSQNVQTSSTVSQPSSSAPIIQEERTTNNQSPFNSSSQSYTTPVESDAEFNNDTVETAKDVVDEHEMLSTPVATSAPSNTSLSQNSGRTQSDEEIPDLEEDVLELVTKSVKEARTEKPAQKVETKKEEVKPEKKAEDESKRDKHANVLNPVLLAESDEDEKTETSDKDSPPNHHLQTNLLQSDDEEEPSVEKENEIPAKNTAASTKAKETTTKELNTEKAVTKKNYVPPATLGKGLLDLDSEDEDASPTMYKAVVKKPQAASTIDESAKKPNAEPNPSLLSKNLLSSTDSSDDEKVKEESPKVVVNERKKSISPPKKIVEVKKSTKDSRLLNTGLLHSDEEEDDSDTDDKKSTKSPVQNKGNEKKQTTTPNQKSATRKKSTTPVTKDNPYILDPDTLASDNEAKVNTQKAKNVEQKDEKSPATLPPNILASDDDSDGSEDEGDRRNKKSKPKSVELVKNIHLLNERYVRPSDSESDSEQFVNIDPKEKEFKELCDKKKDVFDIKDKKDLLSDSDADDGKSSAESEEIESSDEEGPSSIETSDVENNEPKGVKHLEDDLFDLIDNQAVQDFTKNSAEADLKAKEDEAQKNEEKLRSLAKKAKEYEKQGPSKNGVIRLENYLQKVTFDSEAAEMEVQEPPKIIPKSSEAKSKSPVKAEQKPVKDVEQSADEKLEQFFSSLSSAKVEPEKTKAAEVPKQPSKPVIEEKKKSEKPKEVKASYIGKYDPTIPVVGEDFLDQIACSEEVVTVKKAAPIVGNYLMNHVKAEVVMDDSFLDNFGGDKTSTKEKVPRMEDDVLDQIKNDDNIAVKQSVPVMDVNEFLESLSDNQSTVKNNVEVVGDDFLNSVNAPGQRAVTMMDDEDLLDSIIDNRSTVKKNAEIVGDEFLNSIDNNQLAGKKSVKIVGDEFLDAFDDKKLASKKPVPIVDDTFLDSVDVPKQQAIPVIDEDFLNSVETFKENVTSNKAVPMIGDDLLNGITGSGSRSTAAQPIPVVEEDFLNGVKVSEMKPAAKKPTLVVEEDFLDQIGGTNDFVTVKTVMGVNEFLESLSDNQSAVKKNVEVVGDEFLDAFDDKKLASKKPVPIVDDTFLDSVDVPKQQAIPVVDEDFLNSVETFKENVTSNKAVPMIGDDLLDGITGSGSRSTAAQPIPVVEEDFLNGVKVSENKPAAKKPMLVVEEDFLEQIGGTNDFVTVKASAQSMPVSQPPMVVPGLQPFKPVIIHKASNALFFEDDTMSKLINGAEIGINYDSDSSESSSPSNSARPPLAPLEYKLDRYFNIPNFAVVHEMKDKVAKSIPKPKVSHLLNFWLEHLNGCFSDFVVFFQYLQYHVERLNLVDALTPITYRDLVDAVIRREHFFQPIFDLVSNIPLMCQYKFLIFDDNYPDFIYINPDLLELKMIPLAGGLQTAVMYLFNRKRKWLISELRREFPDSDDEDFYLQLCNFLNDRPDLVMLEASKPRATFPQMSIVLNEHVSLRFCCYMFTLEDLHVAEKLHLRDDHINSMKQFIPRR